MDECRCSKKDIGSRVHHKGEIGRRIFHQIKDELMLLQHRAQRDPLLSAHIPFLTFLFSNVRCEYDSPVLDIIYLFAGTRNRTIRGEYAAARKIETCHPSQSMGSKFQKSLAPKTLEKNFPFDYDNCEDHKIMRRSWMSWLLQR